MPTQRERAQVAGFGRGQATKSNAAAKKFLEKYDKYRYNKDGTIVVTDDWTDRGHFTMPKKYRMNAIVDSVSQNGKQRDRTYFDREGRIIKQVHGGNHGRPKLHPYGKNGEHTHEFVYGEDGEIKERLVREINEIERKECADIL